MNSRNQDSAPESRAPASTVTEALNLGWRIAWLIEADWQSLPTGSAERLVFAESHTEVLAPDRMELEARAVAGAARRVGLPTEQIDALVPLASKAGENAEAAAGFRKSLVAVHIEFMKELWCRDEAAARGYELGIAICDTYWLVEQRRRRGDAGVTRNAATAVAAELSVVFSAERVRKLADLLEDLESRLNPTAVEVVRQHLAIWQFRVHKVTPMSGSLEHLGELEPLREQTRIWRGLLAGDRQPEAFVSYEVRRRTELKRRLRRIWLVLALAVTVTLVALSWSAIADWQRANGGAAAGLLGLLVTVLGVLGVSPTLRREVLSEGVTTRDVGKYTLQIDELLPWPQPEPGRFRRAARRLTTRAR